MTYTLTVIQAHALRVLREGQWRPTRFFQTAMSELEERGLARVRKAPEDLIEAQITTRGAEVLEAINMQEIWPRLSLAPVVDDPLDQVTVEVDADA